jgi:hypothetical protein
MAFVTPKSLLFASFLPKFPFYFAELFVPTAHLISKEIEQKYHAYPYGKFPISELQNRCFSA